MTTNLYFKSGYDKEVIAELLIKEDEVTVISILIGNTFYGKKQCARHAWLLYKAVKNHLNEIL